MDQAVQRLLSDKLYDKRKQGALEVERIVRELSVNKDHEKIRKIVEQLCHDYAYAVHQPHARNGGLIGLAAAAIALGSEEVAPYLQEVVPPVLACFTDQDARVRYYACESMYNIAKVAKGEILLFFNDIFDALCKLAADSELSVKNGAELLDRLVKDIVSESAASYVSVLQFSEKRNVGDSPLESEASSDLPTAFSLAKFIPLLEERIHVINPFTRTFLVSWLTLLDTIPDLELVTYLPSFIGGLFKFLGDPNRDVYVATQGLLERFLTEIKRISRIKKGIEEHRKSRSTPNLKQSSDVDSGSILTGGSGSMDKNDAAIADSDSGTANDFPHPNNDGDWMPGQDVQVDYSKILDVLLTFVNVSSPANAEQPRPIENITKQKEEEIGIVALRWIDSFFEISTEDILQFVPRLLSQVLPALSSNSDQVRTTANRVNANLMGYIMEVSEIAPDEKPEKVSVSTPMNVSTGSVKEPDSKDRRPSPPTNKHRPVPATGDNTTEDKQGQSGQLTPRSSAPPTPQPSDLDYAAAVNALTLQFLNEHEATRVGALGWLIMLHQRAPRKVLAFNDGTFPALLKTLSDPAETVVTRDLQLLSQISRNSEDSYFTSFMVNLLQLFSTDRKLLEIRGNLIIRQLCMNLSPERIYRTLADCLEKDEDIEFASIMVQNLNNNLITAPELADLRKRLRNLETKDGQMFFVALFRSWCHNAVATFSLCLLAQAYEQAYHLLQIFAELEMTVNMLIQIDKLVQLLESPVFTYLRLQLLEPERYPYLYKCLYGLLMLLPQSSAFAALKNRLNSVSAIGLLHVPPSRTSAATLPSSSSYPRHHVRQRSGDMMMTVGGGMLTTTSPTSSASMGINMSGSGIVPNTPTSSTFDGTSTSRTGRLAATSKAARDGSGAVGAAGADHAIRWMELLEKFRATQERARRRAMQAQFGVGAEDQQQQVDGSGSEARGSLSLDLSSLAAMEGRGGPLSVGGGGLGSGRREKALPDVPMVGLNLNAGSNSNSNLTSNRLSRPGSGQGYGGMTRGIGGAGAGVGTSPGAQQQQGHLGQGQGHNKGKSSLGNFGRLGVGGIGGVGGRKGKK